MNNVVLKNQISVFEIMEQNIEIQSVKVLLEKLREYGFKDDYFGLEKEVKNNETSLVINKDSGNIWIQKIKFESEKNRKLVISMNSIDDGVERELIDLFNFAKANTVFEAKELFNDIKLREYGY